MLLPDADGDEQLPTRAPPGLAGGFPGPAPALAMTPRPALVVWVRDEPCLAFVWSVPWDGISSSHQFSMDSSESCLPPLPVSHGGGESVCLVGFPRVGPCPAA